MFLVKDLDSAVMEAFLAWPDPSPSVMVVWGCVSLAEDRALIETHWELPTNGDLGNDGSIGLGSGRRL